MQTAQESPRTVIAALAALPAARHRDLLLEARRTPAMHPLVLLWHLSCLELVSQGVVYRRPKPTIHFEATRSVQKPGTLPERPHGKGPHPLLTRRILANSSGVRSTRRTEIPHGRSSGVF